MGHLGSGTFLLFNFMWIPFLWGFLFTGPMKTLPPKENLFLFHLPEKPNWTVRQTDGSSVCTVQAISGMNCHEQWEHTVKKSCGSF